MRKYIALYALGLSSLLVSGCSSKDGQTSPSVQKLTPYLIAPNGVRIATSIGEIQHIAQWIAKGTSKKSEEVTITGIQYKQCCKSPTGQAAATVYYKTLTGKQGHFDVETMGIYKFRKTTLGQSS